METNVRSRSSAKAGEVIDEVVRPLQEVESVFGGRNVDIELFVGIARTFAW